MNMARWLAFCCALCLSPLAWGQVLTLTAADAVPVGVAGAAPHAVTLPHDWATDLPRFTGAVDYRLDFAAPSRGELLGVYVQRACANLEVRVNGELVGSGGRMVEPVTRNCYYPQLYPLPGSLLRAEHNELRIRVVGHATNEVSARQRAAGLSAVQVGPLSELQPVYDNQRFWNITTAQIIATSVGALGLAMLCLWALRRRDSYLLYFGLFTTGWAVISTRLFIRDVPLSHTAMEVLICSTFPPVLGCAYQFLLHLVERRWRWAERALVAQTLLSPIALLIAAPHDLLPVATTIYNLLAVEFLACVLCFFVIAWKTHRQDFWLLGSVLMVAVVLAGAEVALQNDLLPLPKIHLIHFAMPLVFVVIGLRLIQLFVRALQEAETMNEQLERRVAQKSDEIERSWEQIAHLRTAQAAQDERRRIASDLHDDLGAQLLTIAQASQRGGEPDRIAGMARQAMEEMRLSVRGLTGNAMLAHDALADWRAEIVTRLAEAGLRGEWDAQDPPAGMILPARIHVQLTRILREAVSNAIRHSGGSWCRVHVAFAPQEIALQIEDDGRGLPPAGERPQRGHGLLNIERRARNLGGGHAFEVARPGGTLLKVWVPLPLTPSNWAAL
jgi:two-component system sensor histidine kinase UhpB